MLVHLISWWIVFEAIVKHKLHIQPKLLRTDILFRIKFSPEKKKKKIGSQVELHSKTLVENVKKKTRTHKQKKGTDIKLKHKGRE